MSKQGELHEYIARVRRALQLRAGLRGALILFVAALVYTVIAVLVLNHYAFPHGGLVQARAWMVVVLLAAVGLGLAWPIAVLTRGRAVREAETAHPALQDRLTTFQEREHSGDPFIELLAADTLSRTADAPPSTMAPAPLLAAFAGAGVACLAVLLWMIFAGPGYMGYGASALWRGEKKTEQPLYALTVAPGNVAVRRNSDQLITAELTNLHPDKVQIFAQFASSNGWEPVAMESAKSATGNSSYHFVFTGLPQDVEYYVTAGPLTSPHYKVRVVDLPFVKSMKVTYHYPKWTGMKPQAEEHGGDLRAIEGTEAQLEVEMDRPLKDGNLTLDDGKVVHLTEGAKNRYTGSIQMAKDGAYHVSASSEGQPVRLSEDYFIATDKAAPPEIAISHPGQDYRASPIEEVTIGVKGGAQFGLRDMHLHYSVNGGPDKDVNLLKQAGATTADGTYTLRLEDFKLQPGDVVALYATAKDGHAEAKTDISFIQADPFEREFSQSQQGGGGGGGGGGSQGQQTEISKREKELIAQTWKQINDKGATEKSAQTQGTFLSDAQKKLRDQVMALSVRINSRDLSGANEEFTGFEKDMQEAAKNMLPASEKLGQVKWQDALQSEQKSLQALLRAEATFRQIQVAFGQQQGGGGGGGSSSGRDLASLFDLELDTEKNQYETARTSSPQEEHAKEVEDALAKLDALAKRQEEIANQQKDPAQAFQQRWQQEMLRREAEQLQRQMEQLAQDKAGQQGQQGQSGQQGQKGQQGQSGQQSGGQQSASSSGGGQGSSSGGQSSGSGGQSSGSAGQSGSQQQQASSRTQQGGQQGKSGQTSDQRIEQALNRMKAANDAMKRSGSAQGSAESAKEAAQRLREATGLLGGAQQDIAGNRVSGLSREADRIQQEERAQTGRIDKFSQDTQSRNFDPEALQQKLRERNQLAADRQELSNSLSKLQRDMRTAAQGMAGSQPDAAKKLRDALSGMDASDLDNHMQRSADWLRSGINPNSNGTEKNIADGLGKLSQELHAAQGSLGKNPAGQRGGAGDKGDQTAALGQVERLRSQIQAMGTARAGNDRNGSAQGNGQQGSGRQGQQGGNPQGNGNQQGGGQQSARAGGQQGQGSQGQGQQGQGGQRGSGQQGGGQQAGNQQGGGSQQGNGQGGGQGGGGRQQGGSGNGGGALSRGNDIGGGGGNVQSGDISGRTGGGGGNGGTAWGNINTGNNTYAQGSVAQAKDTSGNPADTERTFAQSMRELQALRGMVKDDPQAAKEIADLQRQMQGLDPKRFPGNPALVEQMHGEVLRTVDRLELRLQRSSDITDARTGKPDAVPAGYSDSVADYYRRLSKGR